MIKHKNGGISIRQIKRAAELVKCFLKPIYYTFENLRDSNVLKRNGALKNLYEGQRCFILGTGASLNAIDISKLKNEYTFGCNFLFKHPDHLIYSFYAEPVRPNSMRRIARRSANMNDVDPNAFFQALESYYGSHRATIFLHGSGKKYFEKNNLLRGHDIYYVRPSGPLAVASTLTNDLTKAIPFMDGVIFFMIAASIYMGFKELYLCGCGYTYQPLQSGHFYEDWTKLDYAPVGNRHNIMKKFADDHDVRIFNIVPEGFESPIYEKVTWEHVIKNVLPNSAGRK